MRKRIVYWLCEDVNSVHRSLASALTGKGYEVKFFNTFRTLTEELKARRASIIIIGDETSESQLQNHIVELSIKPELQGTRFVLTVNRFRPKILKIAACCSFRDIIPLNLPVQTWMMRFFYATAGNSMEFEKPQPQIALNEISAMYMPARIVWINQNEIHLETRVRPEIGSMLSLGGDLARSMGVNSITLKSKKRSKNNLAYRFSDGLTASWSVPEKLKEQAISKLAALKPEHFGKRNKVFIAIQGTQLRERVVEMLQPLDFALSIALKKNSMIHEPFYFGPELIIIEEKLLTEDYFKRYIEMVKKLSASVPIIVIGQMDTVRKLREIDPQREIFGTFEVSKDFTDNVFKILSNSTEENSKFQNDSIYLDPKSLLSMGEIRFSARVRQLHPTSATIDLPFAVGPFALGRVDSPLLKKIIKRTPVVKVTNSYKRADEISTPFKYRIESLLSDTFINETQVLTEGLLQFVQTELTEKMSLIKPVPEAVSETAPHPVKSMDSKLHVTSNPIHDLSINKITFEQPTQNTISATASAETSKATALEMDEERFTQLITQDLLDPVAEQQVHDKIKRTPVHIEARDYTYEPAPRRNELPGRLGELIGSRRNLNIIILAGFLSFAAAVLYFTKVYIERDWGRDQGKVFVDSLRGYAPKAFERGLPKKKEEFPPSP